MSDRPYVGSDRDRKRSGKGSGIGVVIIVIAGRKEEQSKQDNREE
jgi:hypothetical protein